MAAVINMTENPPTGSTWGKRFDGLDAMSPSVRAVDTPPAPFVRPGTGIDSDGLMGAPGELHAQRPVADLQADTGLLDDTGTLADVGQTLPPVPSGDFASIGLDATPQSGAALAQATSATAGGASR